jgi:hypothetical protein
MKATLVIAALLCASLFTLRPAQATNRQPQGPVAHGTLILTDAVPYGVLFTPTVTGQYQLNLYSTMEVPDAHSTAQWTFQLGWTDGAGIESAPVLQVLNSAQSFPSAWGSVNGAGGQPGSVSTFITASQTPISYVVTKDQTDHAVLKVFWTLELLQPTQE